MMASATYLTALMLRRLWLGVVATALSAPFCLWVSGYPAIRWVSLLVLGCNVIGLVALQRRERIVAALCWSPFALLAGLLAVKVLRH